MDRGDEALAVPAPLARDIIGALSVGAEAVLDRDWSSYGAGEREDAEAFVEHVFKQPAQALIELLDQLV